MIDQAASLRKQLQQQGKPQARTIAFVSGKGGVGKTNTAINFSLNLLKQNKSVLLIDLDIGMGNIEILLGMQCRYTIVDFFNNHIPLSEMITNGPYDLQFIAGGTGLSRFFQMDRSHAAIFLEQFSSLSALYDYIIFDMGAGVSRDSMEFIMSTDECFVITTPEPTAIMDAYSMIKTIIHNKFDMSIHIIMNQVKSRQAGKQACLQFKQVIDKFLEIEPVQFIQLPSDPLVHKAVMLQQPYTLLNKNAPISEAIEKWTKTYILQGSRQKEPDNTSFIGKLRKWMEKRRHND